MAFKPKNKQADFPKGDFEPRNVPVPRPGNKKARISLIVDLGTQKREDFEEKNQDGTPKLDNDGNPIKRPQKPCQQVVVFADLVTERVDYGGEIGKKQYRMLLNKSFKGVVQGVNFVCAPQVNPKTKQAIEGAPWMIPAQNLLNKLATATGQKEIVYDDRDNPKSLDISLLADRPLMIQVEVKETPHRDGNKDKDGNPIVYKNVNFKGAAPVPEDDDGNPMEVAELDEPARVITFDSATKEDIKFIRSGLIKMIKLATDYAGSQMQKAIEAYEAEHGEKGAEKSGGQSDDSGSDSQEETPVVAPKQKRANKPKPVPQEPDDTDDDIPF